MAYQPADTLVQISRAAREALKADRDALSTVGDEIDFIKNRDRDNVHMFGSYAEALLIRKAALKAGAAK